MKLMNANQKVFHAMSKYLYDNPRCNREMRTVNKLGFKRSLLPIPSIYFTEIEKFQFKGSGTWVKTICPFHDDTNPSLSINLEKGCGLCHACGAKFGDVLAYHMKRHGLSFVEAAKALGSWVPL